MKFVDLFLSKSFLCFIFHTFYLHNFLKPISRLRFQLRSVSSPLHRPGYRMGALISVLTSVDAVPLSHLTVETMETMKLWRPVCHSANIIDGEPARSGQVLNTFLWTQIFSRSTITHKRFALARYKIICERSFIAIRYLISSQEFIEFSARY